MKAIRKIAEVLGIIIIVISILLVGFVLIGPRFGWEVHPILSGSMEPALKVGGIIVTGPEKIQNIEVNDIITFQVSPEYKVTHRVVAIEIIDNKPWFQTKGDSNKDPDANLVSSEEDVMRKVIFHLPYLGFAAVFMQKKLAFIFLIGIPALILIAIFIRDLLKGIREEKEKRRLKKSGSGQGSKNKKYFKDMNIPNIKEVKNNIFYPLDDKNE